MHLNAYFHVQAAIQQQGDCSIRVLYLYLYSINLYDMHAHACLTSKKIWLKEF